MTILTVDSHRFAVPNEFLLPSRVAWLPATGGFDGFVFRDDPSSPLEEQFAVTVESRRVRCSQDNATATQMVADACSEGQREHATIRELRKEYLYPDNDSFWVYTTEADGSRRRQIASCYAFASSESNGICSALGRYSSLIYSFSFNDEDIGFLNDRRAEIESLLSAWQRE